jgi:FKBP-type peptidyl-prolyl cis-trans isomerase
MKPSLGFFAAALIAAGSAAGPAAAQTVAPSTFDRPRPANAISSPGSGFTSLQLIETWGWVIAQEKGLAGIEISQAEISIFLKGLVANLNNGPAPCDLREAFANLQHLIRARHAKLVQAAIRRNESEAKAFFTLLKQNTNAIELPNGLCYEVLKSGNGARPRPGQTVIVHYFGHVLDGTEFAEFGPLGTVLVTNRNVCRGWVEALQRLDKGGRMKLYVPPPLSERESMELGIEPGSARVYDIELLDIKDTSREDLALNTVPPAPEPEPAPSPKFNDLQIIEAWGWSVAQQTRATQFRFGESELAALKQGLIAGIKGRPAPYELQRIYPVMESYVENLRETARQAERQKRLNEMNRFFTDLEKNTNVVALPDGLRYEVVKPGTGPYPQPKDEVKVIYSGRLIDGTVFDRTDDEPRDIEVGGVARGWNEGIQKIGKGGRIMLYIPPWLGFGDMPVSGDVSAIPAHSTLIYDIELLEIEAHPPAAAAPTAAKQ